MDVIFFLSMIVAIVVSIIFALKKKWTHVGFGIAAIILSFIGIGFAAPAPSSTPAPKPTSVVQKQSKIEVEQVQVKSVVAFSTTNKDDTTLAQGTTKTTQEGVNGERTITYEVTYKDGQEQSRKQLSDTVTTVPIDKIVLAGTYVAPSPTLTQTLSPAPPQTQQGIVVKKSSTEICHAPGTTYYDRTTIFTPYSSIDACLASGGRLPLR